MQTGMIRRFHVNLVLCGLLLLSVLGADSCGESPKTVEITILHTNDLHSHFRAEKPGTELNPHGLGGFARLKTLIDRLRAKRTHTLLLDAGDWAEGSLQFFVDGGANVLNLMDAMGYNAAVVGNHDFLNGPGEMASVVERAGVRFPVLGANKDLGNLADRARIERAIPDYTIFELGGVRVAVIGLLCNDFFYFPYFKPGVVTNPVEKASQIARQLHNEKKADVIVLLSHNNFESNVTWARTVPFVNVVVSGHSHKKVPVAIETSNGGRPAYVVEAKQWGQYLGELTLVVNKEENRATLKEYTLHPVTSDLPEDPTIAAMVDEQERLLSQKFGRDIFNDHVAHLDHELVKDDGRETPLPNLLVDAYREATGTDLALESVQLTGMTLPAGTLNSASLINIAPHIYGPVAGRPFPAEGSAWTLKRVLVRGIDIRGLLNIALLAESTGLMGRIAISGGQVSYRSGSASSATAIAVLNSTTGRYEPLDDTKSYSVTLHDGLLMAIGILKEKLGLNIDLSRITDTGVQTWQAVLSHASRKGALKASDYEPGTRYRTLEADLGFYEHQIELVAGASGSELRVTIQNEGLAPSQPGMRLAIFRGPPNDIAGHGVPNSERIPISTEVPVPTLAPGARTTLVVPWQNVAGAGLYTLRAQLLGTDANAANNMAVVYKRLESRR